MTSSSLTPTTSSAGTIQFSGLASGIDTSSIISQLMAVESQPQNDLKTRLAAQQSQLSALQSLNTAVTGIGTAAASFKTSATWTQLTGISSDSSIAVSANNTAVAGSHQVEVQQLATSAQALIPAASSIQPNTTYTLTANGQTVTYTTDADPSFDEIASAINAQAGTTKVNASVIHATGGDVLEINSSQTGTDSNFTFSGGSLTIAGTGQNALATIDNQQVSSTSNTFTNAMDGLTFTASKVTSAPATITVAADGSGRVSAMNAFISQINNVLSQISSATDYGQISTTAGTAGTGAGPLAGDSTLRSVASMLLNTVTPGGKSLSQYGVSVDTDGNLTFDQDAFNAAYAQDPDGVDNAIVGTGGFVDAVANAVHTATDSRSGLHGEGMITAEIDGYNTTINNLNDSISNWNDILTARQQTLQTQYANLETTLSQLQSMGSWVSSQLDSLDSNSSSN